VAQACGPEDAPDVPTPPGTEQAFGLVLRPRQVDDRPVSACFRPLSDPTTGPIVMPKTPDITGVFFIFQKRIIMSGLPDTRPHENGPGLGYLGVCSACA
jgi:hypothetical protein